MSSQVQFPGGSSFSSHTPARTGPVSTAPGTPRPSLGALPAAGTAVDAHEHVEPGTRLAIATTLAVIVVAVGFLVLGMFAAQEGGPKGPASQGPAEALGTLFSACLIGLVFGGASLFAARRARAILRATALCAGPRQFPEIHACASEFARRLGLAEVPEVFVLDAGTVNGFTMKFKKRSMIVLTDETVAACLEGRSPGALAFVLAHELAHVALGHTRWWRLPLRTYRKLSRLDECSADNVACELVASREAAEDGVLLLAIGPRLLPFVDRAAALAQAVEVGLDKSIPRIERTLTHPLTLRRLDRIARRFGTAREAQRRAA